jgi:peptidoglycan/xylan/chitin deacetylase (PgdA/CDA1 family)
MRRLSSAQLSVLRGLAELMSPQGPRASLLVLMYHRVLASNDPMLPDEPDAEAFAAHLDLIRELFEVLTLSDAARRLASRRLPARAACITFDDGYANNCEIAAPMLVERGMPATFFIATGFVDGGCMWNDRVIEAIRYASGQIDLSDLQLGLFQLDGTAQRVRAVQEVLDRLKYLPVLERLEYVEKIEALLKSTAPKDLMMSENQVRKLVELGMEVGAHSVTHPILTRLDENTARAEIVDSKKSLETITGRPIGTFAYPNGRPGRDYDKVHAEIVRAAGFNAAVSTAWGRAQAATDLYQIPRVAPWDRTSLRYALRLLGCYVQRTAEFV